MPTLTSAHDLITAIPFLIGFHPTDSIVLISVKGGAVGLAMRIDLPAQLESDQIDLLAHHFLREESEAALIVAYMPEHRDDGDSYLSWRGIDSQWRGYSRVDRGTGWSLSIHHLSRFIMLSASGQRDA
jgi:hypothetical protein